MTTFYDFSGGMESAAMLVVDRERIRDTGAIVRWADTGRYIPEMYESVWQIERKLGLMIMRPRRRISFEEFLFERGGMIRKGTTDCSRRMKRSNLTRHMKLFIPPYEVNLGFNNEEDDRAANFSARNSRTWLGWRFPLIEADVCRAETRQICERAGFSILCKVYDQLGRFDCYDCGNQTPKQALKLVEYHPAFAQAWMQTEKRKGHSHMAVPLAVLVDDASRQSTLFGESPYQCACFGGDEVLELDEPGDRSLP